MAVKIDKKITSWKIVKEDNTNEEIKLTKLEWESKFKDSRLCIHNTPRDESLTGTTFKIKPSNEKHSLFITINEQKIDGVIYPREIFFSTKNTEHKMWMDALSFLISAVFRQGRDVNFLVEELNNVYNSSGGYWGKNKETGKGKFYKSIVDEIGDVVNVYLKSLNNGEKLPALNETKQPVRVDEEQPEYPKNAEICPSCKQKSALRLDGCLTCLDGACAYSKCG
jgi:hypothetical protein